MLTQNFLIGIVFYSLLYYLPIYYQTARRMGLLTSAALLIPIVIPQAIASALSGQYISRRKRYGEVIWTGYICWVIGTALHCIFSRTTPIVAIVFILMIEGIGVGLVFQPSEYPAILWKPQLTIVISALVAAQAHSPKQDRAVVISARNFIRALGGSAGLAIASAIFSNVLLSSLPVTLPEETITQIRESIFDMPRIDALSQQQQIQIEDAYVKAARSVFYLWAGAMACCLALMVFIKDKGLERQEEKAQPTESVEECSQSTISHPSIVATTQETKSPA